MDTIIGLIVIVSASVSFVSIAIALYSVRKAEETKQYMWRLWNYALERNHINCRCSLPGGLPNNASK